MATQANSILEDLFPDRLEHQDDDIRNASQIIRLIRNAFAHDPFSPTWEISNPCKDKTFSIDNVISLNTHGLHGKKLNRMDYGGPIALLRLIQFIKELIQKDKQH